jgi:hypothetical protein
MAGASYKLLIDWQDNGFGDRPADDVTTRVLDGRTTVVARYGRDLARQFSPISGGTLNFELNNISRDYSPENTSSPLAGYVAPGRHVQFRAIVGTTTTVLYDGYLDDFDIKPGINDRSVPVSCMDALARLRGVTVTTSLYQGLRTGEAIGHLLDAVGWPAGARDIDLGATYMPYWWLDNTDAYQALMDLVWSEGAPALVTVDGQGRIAFRDRHHRLTRTASLTAQATWRSSAVEPMLSDPITYDHGWSEIANALSVDVPVRQPDANPSQVWSSPGLLTIVANTPLTIIATGSNPFTGAILPVAGTDYTLLSGVLSMSLSQTSGQSTTITITSVGGAVIQNLALRATAIQSTAVKVTVEDAPSIAKYGRKSIDGSQLPVWANTYDAAAILTLIIAKRAERLPTLQVTMRGAAGTIRLAECLNRDLSDRVRVTESLTGLDSDCYIEQIQHAVDQGGTQHVTTFGVEKIPPVVTNPFTFDLAGAGFDQGVFMGGGIDNPATMFRFDTAGVGFDQGVFSN